MAKDINRNKPSKEIQIRAEEAINEENEQIIEETIQMNVKVDENGATETSMHSKRILKTAVSLFLGNDHTKRTGEYYSRFEENIYLITEDSETIGAFLYTPKEITENTQFFVVCHGKGCDRYQIRCFVDFHSHSDKNNSCFLLIDYRGFADSSGEYTIKGVNYDILAAFQYLKKEFNASSISLIGHSLGTAAVMEYGVFALEQEPEYIPKRIFVISPFTSTLEICRDFTIFSLISFFIPTIIQIIKDNFNYDSVSNAKVLGNRLFVFHGSKDTIVSVEHGRTIAEAANCDLLITDHNHINIFSDASTWKRIFKENV